MNLGDSGHQQTSADPPIFGSEFGSNCQSWNVAGAMPWFMYASAAERCDPWISWVAVCRTLRTIATSSPSHRPAPFIQSLSNHYPIASKQPYWYWTGKSMPADSRCHPAYLGPSDPSTPMESTGERHWRGTGAHKRRRLIWRQFEELASRKIAAILEGQRIAGECCSHARACIWIWIYQSINLSIYQSIYLYPSTYSSHPIKSNPPTVSREQLNSRTHITN